VDHEREHDRHAHREPSDAEHDQADIDHSAISTQFVYAAISRRNRRERERWRHGWINNASIRTPLPGIRPRARAS
jgi:hypothetical protein